MSQVDPDFVHAIIGEVIETFHDNIELLHPDDRYHLMALPSPAILARKITTGEKKLDLMTAKAMCKEALDPSVEGVNPKAVFMQAMNYLRLATGV